MTSLTPSTPSPRAEANENFDATEYAMTPPQPTNPTAPRHRQDRHTQSGGGGAEAKAKDHLGLYRSNQGREVAALNHGVHYSSTRFDPREQLALPAASTETTRNGSSYSRSFIPNDQSRVFNKSGTYQSQRWPVASSPRGDRHTPTTDRNKYHYEIVTPRPPVDFVMPKSLSEFSSAASARRDRTARESYQRTDQRAGGFGSAVRRPEQKAQTRRDVEHALDRSSTLHPYDDISNDDHSHRQLSAIGSILNNDASIEAFQPEVLRMAFSEEIESCSAPVRLFIARIPSTFHNCELRRMFAPFGALLQCNIIRQKGNGRSRGCGFVRFAEFRNGARAVHTLNDLLRNARSDILVKFAFGELSRLQMPPTLQPGGECIKVFVGDLGPHATVEDLMTLFLVFGPIEDASVLRNRCGASKCSGFVTFYHYEDALQAIRCLNNAMRLPGSKKSIEVRFAESKRKMESTERRRVSPVLRLSDEAALPLAIEPDFTVLENDQMLSIQGQDILPPGLKITTDHEPSAAQHLESLDRHFMNHHLESFDPLPLFMSGNAPLAGPPLFNSVPAGGMMFPQPYYHQDLLGLGEKLVPSVQSNRCVL